MRGSAPGSIGFLFVALIYLLSEVLVNPLGEFPLNDDWSYTKSVLILTEQGRLDIGQWPAMTLATHLLWGAIFVKIFGFTFFVLRLSNLISGLIALYILFRLSLELTTKTRVAIIAALTLLCNPLFFNLCNTYMTDINFLTLLLLGFIVGREILKEPTLPKYLAFALIAVLLVLLRQYGILLPFAFLVAALSDHKSRGKVMVFAVVTLAVAFVGLKLYEKYLFTTLEEGAAYKFTGKLAFFTKEFWVEYFNSFSGRYRIIITHGFFYTAPFVLGMLPAVMKEHSKKIVLITGAVILVIVYLWLKDHNFQPGNIFTETAVGADTSFETLTGSFGEFPHYYDGTFNRVVNLLMIVFTTGGLLLFTLMIIRLITSREKKRPAAFTAFAGFFLLCYAASTLLTESFFDRYQLPAILAMLLFAISATRSYEINGRISGVVLALFLYVSVAGTRDYFQLNRLRWQVYSHLRNDLSIPLEKINGGFEVNCWNDGKESWWTDFMNLKNYDYLIQYRKEEGFERVKAYPFQRYLPVMTDTLNLYRRKIQ